jgi:hypothetical protein
MKIKSSLFFVFLLRIGEHNPANNHCNFAYSFLAWV